LVFQVVGEDDYYGFNDDTAVPDRAEADRAVNTIAALFSGRPAPAVATSYSTGSRRTA
jgi:hypothetical protein